MENCEYYNRTITEHNHPVFGKAIEEKHLCNKGMYVNTSGMTQRKTSCSYFKNFSSCPIKSCKPF
jgi:hypothetical protein